MMCVLIHRELLHAPRKQLKAVARRDAWAGQIAEEAISQREKRAACRTHGRGNSGSNGAPVDKDVAGRRGIFSLNVITIIITTTIGRHDRRHHGIAAQDREGRKNEVGGNTRSVLGDEKNVKSQPQQPQPELEKNCCWVSLIRLVRFSRHFAFLSYFLPHAQGGRDEPQEREMALELRRQTHGILRHCCWCCCDLEKSA